MQKDIEYYKNLDISRAKHVKPDLIKKLQERHAAAQAKAFDVDVVEWLATQDNETKQHINDMIRHFMALHPVSH